VLSRLGITEGFALTACEMLDEDYPNLTPDDDDQRWCDECGEGISSAEYLSGQGLCISCIRAAN
jgi:formylmethanofuran dehydrogenase subunit E